MKILPKKKSKSYKNQKHPDCQIKYELLQVKTENWDLYFFPKPTSCFVRSSTPQSSNSHILNHRIIAASFVCKGSKIRVRARLGVGYFPTLIFLHTQTQTLCAEGVSLYLKPGFFLGFFVATIGR